MGVTFLGYCHRGVIYVLCIPVRGSLFSSVFPQFIINGRSLISDTSFHDLENKTHFQVDINSNAI